MQATVKMHVNFKRSDGIVLEKICLLHDTEELLLVNLTVSTAVRLIDHLLKFLISHAFAKLFCHALQVLERDFSSFVIIEKTERFQDLVFGIAVQNLVRHHFQELFIPNGATP